MVPSLKNTEDCTRLFLDMRTAPIPLYKFLQIKNFLFRSNLQNEINLKVFAFWLQNIHGDSREKINILGGENIGHCEKKISFEYVSNSQWLLR